MAGVDLDRYFVRKDLEELNGKTFDGLGLDVRGVIPSSDLYERARASTPSAPASGAGSAPSPAQEKRIWTVPVQSWRRTAGRTR